MLLHCVTLVACSWQFSMPMVGGEGNLERGRNFEINIKGKWEASRSSLSRMSIGSSQELSLSQLKGEAYPATASKNYRCTYCGNCRCSFDRDGCALCPAERRSAIELSFKYRASFIL
ncbi:hypothetical protein O6P43_013127 [Quillaja saponaria]|uniref:Uncharacterized protein n=1 Tax=Quillaja saponaria TaxID=32244 RepID=A0AAD7M3J1_QUISA|nr:hypothetical protein O6P43_013127 [Quillaja saponaria]KAJ7969123.1 hypothetical protein O6P43_013127 [Quillaja saponaria]